MYAIFPKFFKKKSCKNKNLKKSKNRDVNKNAKNVFTSVICEVDQHQNRVACSAAIGAASYLQTAAAIYQNEIRSQRNSISS